MILNFTVKNYKSFYDETTLDFVIENGRYSKNQLENNPYIVCVDEDLYVSKVILLYGHNASGKSNLLEAISSLLILDAEKLFNPNMIDGKNEDTYFEVQFTKNNLVYSDTQQIQKEIYTYSVLLSYSESKIKEEILKCDEKIIFYRSGNKINKDSDSAFEQIQGIPDRQLVFKYIENVSDYKNDENIKYFRDIISSIRPLKMSEEIINNITTKNIVAIMMPYLRSQLALLTAQPNVDTVNLEILNVGKMF